MPGTHAAPVGPWNEKVKVPSPFGATLPLTAAARSGASQLSPEKMLTRSRGIVVPSIVDVLQDLEPTFFMTICAATVSPHLTVKAGCEAYGHDWLTNLAAYGAAAP